MWADGLGPLVRMCIAGTWSDAWGLRLGYGEVEGRVL